MKRILLIIIIVVSSGSMFVYGQVHKAKDISPDQPLQIGSRLELFVDSLLIDHLDNLEFRLHSPVQLPLAESPLKGGQYMTVIKDGNIYRGYYRSAAPDYTGPTKDGHPGEITCYAESADGHEWNMPDLDFYEISGLKNNNVILTNMMPFSHNFSPFLDTRPGVDKSERYKAIAGTRGSGLHTFISPNGIHWKKADSKAAIPFPEGKMQYGGFDSQNVAFWSDVEQVYVCYCRTKDTPHGNLRSVSRATSPDFKNWTELVRTNPNLPGEQLYTNNTHPYFRAPHIYIALPTRFMLGRLAEQSIKGNIGSTDILFMSTRAGSHSYDRLFSEAIIRPGLDPASWGNRANYVALNVLPTGPEEMSIYHRNGYRYVLRTDGFISIRAGSKEGEMLTKPLIFEGKELIINYSTSAVGRIKAEIQDANGRPVDGFQLDNCLETTGDEIEGVIRWKESPDPGKLAGKAIRIRFVMKECDLYSFRFQ